MFKKILLLRSFILIFAFIFLFSRSLMAAELRLEGMMYDEASPQKSIAIVNGEPVHVGMKFQGYLVGEITPKSIILYHLETEEKKILFVEAAKKPESKIHATSRESGEMVEGSEEIEPESLMEKVRNAPARLVNRGVELKVIYDIAIINNACVNYYNQMGFFPGQLKQLTNAGLIKKEYAEGTTYKYKFYFDPVQHADRFGFHADPIEPQSGLQYFFVSEDAVVRASKKGPANRSSPRHEYPGLPK